MSRESDRNRGLKGLLGDNEVENVGTPGHIDSGVELLVDKRTFIRVLASLAASLSLLERATAKTAAPSNKMFDAMLADYQDALDAGREAIKKAARRKHD